MTVPDVTSDLLKVIQQHMPFYGGIITREPVHNTRMVEPDKLRLILGDDKQFTITVVEVAAES